MVCLPSWNSLGLQHFSMTPYISPFWLGYFIYKDLKYCKEQDLPLIILYSCCNLLNYIQCAIISWYFCRHCIWRNRPWAQHLIGLFRSRCTTCASSSNTGMFQSFPLDKADLPDRYIRLCYTCVLAFGLKTRTSYKSSSLLSRFGSNVSISPTSKDCLY